MSNSHNITNLHSYILLIMINFSVTLSLSPSHIKQQNQVIIIINSLYHYTAEYRPHIYFPLFPLLADVSRQYTQCRPHQKYHGCYDSLWPINQYSKPHMHNLHFFVFTGQFAHLCSSLFLSAGRWGPPVRGWRMAREAGPRNLRHPHHPLLLHSVHKTMISYGIYTCQLAFVISMFCGVQ